jgi:multimeric flavodoxin WrbA
MRSSKKLIIHDMSEPDFLKVVPVVEQDTIVISNAGNIRACIGCYGCWIKTPGVCIIKDDYQNIGRLFSQTDELIVISRCFYGSYSPFVKNIWDRSISYLLPYFVKSNDETHHKRRYTNTFNLRVHFYGNGITIDEKMTAEKFIKANNISYCTNNPQVFFYNNIQEMEGKIV